MNWFRIYGRAAFPPRTEPSSGCLLRSFNRVPSWEHQVKTTGYHRKKVGWGEGKMRALEPSLFFLFNVFFQFSLFYFSNFSVFLVLFIHFLHFRVHESYHTPPLSPYVISAPYVFMTVLHKIECSTILFLVPKSKQIT